LVVNNIWIIKLLSAVITSLITSLTVLVLNFFSSILLARLLGPETRGEYGSIILVISLIAGLSQFGFGQAYIYGRRKLYPAKGMLLYLIVIIITVLITSTALISILEGRLFLAENRWSLYALAIITALLMLLSDITKLQATLKIYNMKLFISAVVNALLLLTCFIYGFELSTISVIFITLCTLLSSAFVVIPFVIKEEVINKKISHSIDWLYLYSYGFKTYATSVSGILVLNFDKIFLFFVGDFVDFGVYIVAFGLSRMVGIIPMSISNVIFSKYAGVNEQALAKITSIIFSLLFIPLMSISLFIAAIGSFLILNIYGPQYSDATLPFSILVIECTISALAWILAQRFSAAGRPGLVLLRQLISMLPLLSLFIYLPPYNIEIVLASLMLLSSIIRLALTMYIYPKIYKEQTPSLIPTLKEIKFAVKKIMDKYNESKSLVK
jgi:O-antigen/teichoic acid export membrane protein